MSDGEAPNVLTPRQLACALIATALDDVDARISAEVRQRRAPNLFHSQIEVFLRQTAWELRRAAQYLELTDASDDA